MNHILYNISLIILSLGIILMTIYVTKSYNINTYISPEIDPQTKETMNQDAYTQRPGTIFKDMFLQNSSWLNKYQSIDNSAQPNLYI